MFRASENAYLPQRSLSVPTTSGQSATAGRTTIIETDESIDFIAPKESYLQFDFAITTGADHRPFLVARGSAGVSACIENIRIFSRRTGELLESVQEYGSLCSAILSNQTNDPQRSKLALTEGYGCDWNVIANPFFKETNANAVPEWKTTTYCLDLHGIGMFADYENSMIPNGALGGLRIEVEWCRNVQKALQRLNGISTGLNNTYGNFDEFSASTLTASADVGQPYYLEVDLSASDIADGDSTITILSTAESIQIPASSDANAPSLMTEAGVYEDGSATNSFPIRLGEKVGLVQVAKDGSSTGLISTGLSTGTSLSSLALVDAGAGALSWSVGITNPDQSGVGKAVAGGTTASGDLTGFFAGTNDKTPDGAKTDIATTNLTGAGLGLTVDYTVTGGDIDESSIVVNNVGSGYFVADTIQIDSSGSQDTTFDMGVIVAGWTGGATDTTNNSYYLVALDGYSVDRTADEIAQGLLDQRTTFGGVQDSGKAISSTFQSVGFLVSNINLIVNEVKPTGDFMSRMRKGGMKYHYKSYSTYKVNIPQAITNSAVPIPITNKKVYSILAQPCSQERSDNQAYSWRNLIKGSLDGVQRTQYQVNNVLMPDRQMEVRPARFGQIQNSQYFYTLRNALEGCDVPFRNVKDSAENFLMPIQLGHDQFSYDFSSGVDVLLFTEYLAPVLNKLVKVFVCIDVEVDISPSGVSVSR